MCTHNNNKTLCFCKIMKANRMRFLPSRSVNLSVKFRNSVYACLTDMKNISREWNVYFQINQFKWKTYILRLSNTYERCIEAHHYCGVGLGDISDTMIMRILSVKPVPWLAVNLHHLLSNGAAFNTQSRRSLTSYAILRSLSQMNRLW